MVYCPDVLFRGNGLLFSGVVFMGLSQWWPALKPAVSLNGSLVYLSANFEVMLTYDFMFDFFCIACIVVSIILQK